MTRAVSPQTLPSYCVIVYTSPSQLDLSVILNIGCEFLHNKYMKVILWIVNAQLKVYCLQDDILINSGDVKGKETHKLK